MLLCCLIIFYWVILFIVYLLSPLQNFRMTDWDQNENYATGLQNAIVSHLEMELQHSRQQADKANRIMIEMMNLQQKICQETEASFVRLQEKLQEIHAQSFKTRTTVRLCCIAQCLLAHPFACSITCLSRTHLPAYHSFLLFTHSIAHTLACKLGCSRACFLTSLLVVHQINCSLNRLHTRLIAHSLACLIDCSLSRLLTHLIS